MSRTSLHLYKVHTSHPIGGGWCYVERSHIMDDYGNAVRLNVPLAAVYMEQGRGE